MEEPVCSVDRVDKVVRAAKWLKAALDDWVVLRVCSVAARAGQAAASDVERLVAAVSDEVVVAEDAALPAAGT